jgi:ABC-type sugar transport system substrate-binding protein
MERAVGLFLMSAHNAHQLANEDAAQERARAHGVDLQVFFADSVAAQQSQDVIRFLYNNPGRQLAVVIMPLSDVDITQGAFEEHPVQKLARRVVSRKAAWMVLNRDAETLLEALQRDAPDVPIGLVTPDQKEIGRIQGRQFRHLLPKGGRVLYVAGNPFVSSTRDRRTGVQEALAGAAQVTLDEIDGYWSADKARDAVLKWLAGASGRGEWPALVGCQNDEMAQGAVEALADAARRYAAPALTRVPVTGIDGLPLHGRKWVAEGKLAATIVLPTTADVAIDVLARAWSTGARVPLKTIVPVTPFPADSVGPSAAASAERVARPGSGS